MSPDNFLSPAPRGFAARSRVLARLASLAQLGELARRLSETLILYVLWFNFMRSSNFLFFRFKLIIMLLSYITIPKNKRKENLNQG